MELSGLIFVALALVWAVVLIPKALRHHDELAETRSVDEVSDGVRVLARREAVSATSSRLVVAAEEPAVIASLAPATAATAVRLQVAARTHRAAAVAAARRRRRVLLVLLVVTAGTSGAGVAGHLPAWAAAVPAGLIAAFLVVARVTVRREQARWESYLASRDAVEVHEEVLEIVEEPDPCDVEDTQAIPLERLRAQAALEPEQRPAVESTPTVPSEAEEQQVTEVQRPAEAELTTDAGSLWDPLPVTLPTYVGKPRATRSVRTIDLSAPGVASAGRDAAASALVAEAATAAEPGEPQQRVVGG